VTLQSGTLDCSPTSVMFQGNYSQSGGTFFHGSPSLTFDGTFTLTGGDFQKLPLGGSTITMNGDVFLNGGTFGASSFRTFISNDFRINGTVFNHNNGTVIFNAPAASLVQVGTNQLVFNNVRFDSSLTTFLQTLDGTSWITANGSSQFRFGGFEKHPASPAIPSFRANGDVTMTDFSFNTLLSLRFEGTVDQTFTQTGGFNFNGWTVNKSSGTLLLAQDTTVDTLFLQKGTITTNTNTLTPSNVSRTTGYVIGNLKFIFTAPSSRVFHVGTATGYSPVTANVTAVNLVQGAEDSLKIQAIDGTAPSTPPLPNSTTLDRHWEISESGDVTADLTFSYLQTDVDGGEAAYNLIRTWPGVGPISFPNGSPCPGVCSPCVDTAANTILINGVVDFTDFWTAGAPTVPTSANATITGRVVSTNGMGVGNVVMSLAGFDGTVRITRTNPFGYFRFFDVATGQTYVLSGTSKTHQVSARTLTLASDIVDLEVTATP
ncbi:MAG TPA: carboxypeptidase-like regulatory domain-containing protein, partial [Pyrinomonadaceae bacterium]|nr:carboxypeptidase-like regulatory domain-containing protein [Pyrinomonadaceae bacterium]